MKSNHENYFRLYECCRITRGYRKCIIYDIQRTKLFSIPHSLIKFIGELKSKSVKIVLDKYGKKEREIIQTYLEFLIANDLGNYFRKEELRNFIQLDTRFDSPSLIHDAIIKLNHLNINSNLLHKIFETLQLFGCFYIQIVFLDKVSSENTALICEISRKFNIKELQLIFQSSRQDCDLEFCGELAFSNPTISIFKFNNHQIKKSLDYRTFTIEFDKKNQNLYHQPCLVYNSEFYFEALKFNSFHNKKIVLFNDKIENSNDSGIFYGVINSDNVQKWIVDKQIKDLWVKNKDCIVICKSCEYRFNCFDPRKIKKNIINQNYFETECVYNPFIGKWQGEDGYKSLLDCGIVSDAFGLKINRNKLRGINNTLWLND
jgi:SPASM domain peptide maturase of grasp-with-spasm system